jgi:elongation factor P
MNDLKINLIIELEDDIYQVLSKDFIRNAQRRPVMSTKLKNLISGKIVKHTFQQSDVVKEAIIEKNDAQFLYKDEDSFFFMNNETFEQFSLPKNLIGSNEKFLKENTDVAILKHEDTFIGIDLPIKMNFKVISAPPDTKGNSAQSSDKEVEIETGFKIKAPLFIKENDVIKINTEKGIYVERISN